MPRKTDKRQRLIKAARELIRRQGFDPTTLADIAEEARVPLGNVYYYFKTKDAIGEAVIESRAQELEEHMASWDEHADPRDRLFAMLQQEIAQADDIARFGCPLGGLSQELSKRGGPLADAAAALISRSIQWAEKQFRSLGFGDAALDLAQQYVALIQGTSLLTTAFKDPKLLAQLGHSVRSWLEKSIAKGKGTAPISPAVMHAREEELA